MKSAPHLHNDQGHDPRCKHLLHSLSEYIDGELETKLCAELERHMEGCENCRIVVDSLRKTVSLYRESNDAIEVPADMRQRLFHTLDLDDFLKA